MGEERERPRRKRRRIEHPNHVRFLTFSCDQRLALLSNPKIADAFVAQLARTRERLRFALIAWVVMPQHVHLLLWPSVDIATVPVILRALKQPVGQRVITRWKRLNATILPRLLQPNGLHTFWQPGGGHDRNVFSDKELAEKIEYIHWNPVRRGLVARPEDWAWSSARWYAGMRDGQVAIDPVKKPS